MRYKINIDRLVNQFLPYYLGGRNCVLYLQAVLSPLKPIARSFDEWAKETRIDASMTSQVFYFEWFLNRRFSKYFLNPNDRIFILAAERSGVPMYSESAAVPDEEHVRMRGQSEGGDTAIFHGEGELEGASGVSFEVAVPIPNESYVTQDDYLKMIKAMVDRYKLSNKTYKITIQ